MSGGGATLQLVCTVHAVLHSVTTERLKNALQQATGIDRQRQVGKHGQTGTRIEVKTGTDRQAIGTRRQTDR